MRYGLALLAFFVALALFAISKEEQESERVQPVIQEPTLPRPLAAIFKLRPDLEHGLASRVSAGIMRYCNPALHFHMVAIIYKESNFQPLLVSQTGDYGLAQVNPTFHPYDKAYLLTIEGNLRAACGILEAANQRGDYARYHSNTPKLRRKYRRHIELILRRIRNEELS